MVESKCPKVFWNVTVVNYEVTSDKVVNYKIKVDGPRDITFHIIDRYSSLRELQWVIKLTSKSSKGWPNFPKKKLFGNTEPSFLMQRQKDLELFLN